MPARHCARRQLVLRAAAIEPGIPQTGKRNEAMAIIEELKTRQANRQAYGLDIARIYLGLGDKEQAFAWLEKDFQAHSSTLPSWIFIPPLNELRGDVRFKDLARRIGIQ